jgi:peptide/nickel transport system permease protein
VTSVFWRPRGWSSLATESVTRKQSNQAAVPPPNLAQIAETQALRSGRGHRVRRELVRNRFALTGTIFLLLIGAAGLLAPLLATHLPHEQSLMSRLAPPSSEHWLGTDELGRDEYSRILYGARISLFISFVGTAGGVLIGTLIGLTSGYFGGWLDTVAMRLIDVMFAFPGILLAILIVAVMGPGIFNLVVALVVFAAPTLSRIVRSSVLSLKSQEFVQAAHLNGASRTRIMVHHLLPNIMAPIIIFATLGVAGSLLTTASLGFLGLGVQPPTAEWGAMLSVGRNYLRDSPHLVIVPGLLILGTVMSLNLIGDALRDTLDPHTST